ncbi:MAG: c-type cytochrome biogenesis protein CcsB [Oscillatoriales cyanobacterium]|jgi:cytochrome c-type biogenesis protein CcsB|nr:MAG: c-type cytochrome biogenesis protein CcsB [Oscillatoriales cyanobacterium]
MDLVSLQSGLDNIAFLVLFVSMLIYWVGVAFPQLTLLPSLGTAGMAIANLCIATLLGARWIDAGYFPISNLYESLFFLTWGITTIHLIAESMSRSRLVGAFTATLGMGTAAFATITLPPDMQLAEPLVPALQSNWLMMHVSVMMLSYSTLMVGSLLAIAFLVVTRGQAIELRGSSIGTGGFRAYTLKRGGETVTPAIEPAAIEPTPVFATASGKAEGNTTIAATTATATLDRLTIANVASPETTPLSPQRLNLADTLDNISYRIIGLGFPLLTIGIISGAVWANEAWGTYWSWDPKETWAFITWLVFAAYLHARITRGWQGRRPAILATVGLGVVWVCYLGVNLLGKGLHSYGWFL